LPAVPSLDELLEMSLEAIQGLSIFALKAVLFRNHVNTGMVVEKAELVAKVVRLVEDERVERSAAARRHEEEDAEREEREFQEVLERSRREHEEAESARRQAEQYGYGQYEGERAHEGAAAESSEQYHDGPAPSSRPAEESTGAVPTGKLSPKAQAMASHLERTGLCVICQDEEANIAIVDCGYVLALMIAAQAKG
jgi:hypothetical protein